MLVDLEMLALAYEGCALVHQGKIAEGMHCLDEAAAAGDYMGAKGHFEDAAYLFDRSDAPFERASVRLELARCLFTLGQPEAAELQAQDARESFQILGAAAEAERAAALLHELQTRARSGDTLDLASLSQREVEILRLVAQGLSNQEIATRLVLSKHTVHRHVSRILAKLDLPSRAAAAAYAAQQGLL